MPPLTPIMKIALIAHIEADQPLILGSPLRTPQSLELRGLVSFVPNSTPKFSTITAKGRQVAAEILARQADALMTEWI